MQYDIYGSIAKEIQSFQNDFVHIAGVIDGDSNRYLQGKQRGYDFSQYKMLNLIDLYYNSKFESGELDSEGQRKLFLNICAFRADVASKMIDLDTKDFLFVPDDADSRWGAHFISKEFRDWARQNYFGEFINECVENLPKYGTVVGKRVNKKIERVPLRNLIVDQKAKNLQVAKHVIEVHEDMSLEDMKEFPDWKTDGLDLKYGQTTTVYERYGTIPAQFYYYWKEEKMPKSEENKSIECVLMCTLTPSSDKKDFTGTVLFLEKVKERPYREAHWKKQEGRWLGVGEVENQLENQISRNMITNLRRRALLWSSKKVFQSVDDTIAKNLIRNVKDGDVVRIMPNGNITQIDMTSREVGEFQSAEQIWEKNSDQKSFTFEVATGESMPSGTPFRLGVVLSNAVSSHFNLKKENLAFFFKKIVLEDVFEIFKKENKRAHTITVFGTERGINDLKKAASELELTNRLTKWAFTDDDKPIPDFQIWKKEIEQSYQEKSHLFIDIPDSFYDKIKHHLELVITGEEMDTASEISSLTTLYQSMVQSQDPRAEQVLQEIFALRGKNLEAMLGPKPQPQIAPPAAQGGGMPNVALSANAQNV